MFLKVIHNLAYILFLTSLISCTSQELKNFGADVAHNVGCDQQYDHMHKQATLRDDCLNSRP